MCNIIIMNEKQIIALVSKSLRNKKINNKSSSSNTEQWDSLGHLSIMASLDKVSKGKSSKFDLTQAHSIQKLTKILKNLK
tara:strand:- start:2541 stop:2780 length:240 start_codon:yes stop_codon:yes gene_type:complete